MGVVREEEGIGARALEAHGVEESRLRIGIVRLLGRGEETVAGQIPFTPAGKKAIELSLTEALNLEKNYVGTEHILLGLLRLEGTAVTTLLNDLDVDPEELRAKVLELEAARLSRSFQPARPIQRSLFRRQESSSQEPDKEEGADEEAEEDEGPEAVPTHPDRPATVDELGRERLAEVLAERMRRVRGEDTEQIRLNRPQRRRKLRRDRQEARRAGSFLVHLHAPWGAGKSSLLNFVAADLRNRRETGPTNWLLRMLRFPQPRQAADPSLSQWIVVDFSAWEHQRLATPWWWLLAGIQRACGRELWQINRGRWAWFWARDLAWQIWNARAAVFSLLLVAAALVIAGRADWLDLDVGTLSALQAVVVTVTSALALGATLFGLARGAGRWLAIGSAEGASRFLRRAHDPLGVYRRRFRWLVRSSGRPIAVFIDDLDRCRSEYVVELLEGIQTLFSTEPVAYVVAADRAWLCESFASVYGEFEETVGEPGRPLGFLFLEKTFQISMEIPPMTPSEREAYWNRLMRGQRNGLGSRGKGSAPESDAFHGTATQAEVEARVEELLRSQADPDQVMVAAVRRLNAPDLQEQLERLLSEFAPLLERNPRSMKRLLNAYGIERDRLLRNGQMLSKQERRQLALLTILRLRWPEFADHLRRCPEDTMFCVDAAEVPPDDHPFRVLFADPELQRLFDRSHVDIGLDRELIEHFPSDSASSR